MSSDTRPIVYLGSSKKDLNKLPLNVKEIFMHGLHTASIGKTPVGSKVLKGFSGRSVVE